MAVTLTDLAGYIERDLDTDLARWFSDDEPITLEEEVRPVEPFLAQLGPADAAALAAFDRRVRSGAMLAFHEDGALGQDGVLHEDLGLLNSLRPLTR